MAGKPPENNDVPPGGAKKPRRPKEFSPAGKRGDDTITRNLKAVYEEVAAEPTPPDIMKLLNQLGDQRPGDKKDV